MRTEELASIYQSKSDDELLALAQSEGLTPEAEFVLRNEMARRGIRFETEVVDTQESETASSDARASLVRATHSVSEFAAAVTRMYRDNFALFFKLAVPAMAVSYIAIALARMANLEIAKDLFRRGGSAEYNLDLFKVTLINLAAHFISGLASCASFAAICVAVDQVGRTAVVSAVDCIARIPKRLGAFFGLSLLLMVLVYLSFAVGALAVAALVWKIKPPSGVVQGAMIATVSLCFLLISRFGLAMPAVILDDYKVGAAMFRSDELTEGKWLTLAMLLIKSVFGAYIVGMLPFWIATLIWKYVHLPGWFLTLCSYLGVTMVEPFMFIGFALLYTRVTSAETEPDRQVWQGTTSFSQ